VREDNEVHFDLLQFYRNDLQLLGLNTLNLNSADCAMILEEVARPIETKWLTPQEIETRPFSDAIEAYTSPNNSGKKRVLTMR
jgi:hypothetical protein